MSDARAGNTEKGGITVSVECLDRMTAAANEADKKVRAFADAVGCGQPPQEWYDEDMDGLWDERCAALEDRIRNHVIDKIEEFEAKILSCRNKLKYKDRAPR